MARGRDRIAGGATPVLTPEQPWEGDLLWSKNATIWDDDEKVFKMWYHATGAGGTEDRICLATSSDGANWDRPELGMSAWDGSTRNNLLAANVFQIVCGADDRGAPPDGTPYPGFERSEALTGDCLDTPVRFAEVTAVSDPWGGQLPQRRAACCVSSPSMNLQTTSPRSRRTRLFRFSRPNSSKSVRVSRLPVDETRDPVDILRNAVSHTGRDGEDRLHRVGGVVDQLV